MINDLKLVKVVKLQAMADVTALAVGVQERAPEAGREARDGAGGQAGAFRFLPEYFCC